MARAEVGHTTRTRQEYASQREEGKAHRERYRLGDPGADQAIRNSDQRDQLERQGEPPRCAAPSAAWARHRARDPLHQEQVGPRQRDAERGRNTGGLPSHEARERARTEQHRDEMPGEPARAAAWLGQARASAGRRERAATRDRLAVGQVTASAEEDVTAREIAAGDVTARGVTARGVGRGVRVGVSRVGVSLLGVSLPGIVIVVSLPPRSFFVAFPFGVAIGRLGRSVDCSPSRRNAKAETNERQPGPRAELTVQPAATEQAHENAEPEFEPHRRVAGHAFPVLLHSLLAERRGSTDSRQKTHRGSAEAMASHLPGRA